MLEEKIMNDYKDAMKNKDTLKSQTLSFLRSQLMNAALEKKKNALSDSEVIAVIRKQIKQRQDSIEQFIKGNRLDLVDKESKELVILKEYLPVELSGDELNAIINSVIAETCASSLKDMGKVMKEVTVKVAGKADPKIVSDLVKQKLSQPQA